MGMPVHPMRDRRRPKRGEMFRGTGPMRQRLEVQEVTLSKDAFAAVTETWTTVDTVWAAIEPISGREVWGSNEVSAEATHRIRLRWFEGLTTEHRFRIPCSTRVFNIGELLNPDERQGEHVSLCTERTATDQAIVGMMVIHPGEEDRVAE